MVLCCCKRPSQTTSSEPAGAGGVYKSPPIPPPLCPGPGLCGFAIRLLPSSCSHTFEILPARFSDRDISALWWWSLGGRMIPLLLIFF